MAAELEREAFPGFTRGARERLLAHPWPGNVRELRNAVERSVYRHGPSSAPIGEIVLDPFDVPWRLPRQPGGSGAAAPGGEGRSIAPGSRPPPGADRGEQAGGEGASPETGAPEHPSASRPAPVPGARLRGQDFDRRMNAHARTLLEEALEASGGNQSEAARRLGLGYHRLRRMLARHGLVGRRGASAVRGATPGDTRR